MSIFKESFKPFVKKQTETRQTKIGQGDRTYFLQRQCTIRMASGVNINNSSLTAKTNVLEGGIKTVTSTTTTTGEGESATTSVTNKFSNKGGFGGAYDAASDGFGNVPMPGITSVNIRTKTAYGSLREAIVKFECHSTKQLSTLEKLYMRPGYPCLLEWAWEPYFNNEGSKQFNIIYISNNPSFWNGGYNQDTIQNAIINKKEATFGNYDGLYGIVKNFNYSVRPDGGYSCTTELISIGEVLGSIKGVLSSENFTKSNLEKAFEDLVEYADALSLELKEKGEVFGFEVETDIEDVPSRDPDQQKLIDTTIDSIKSKRKQKAKNKLDKFNELGIKVEGDILSQNKGLETDLHPSVWIRWGSLLKLINNSINEDANENKLIKIADENDNLEFNLVEIEDTLNIKTSDNDLSFANQSDSTYKSKQKNLSISINPNICLFPENVKSLFSDINISNPRRISNVYFEVSYLLKTFKSQFYTKDEFDEQIENEDFSLGNFLKKIWGDVNSSCANIHNFNVINDFEKNHVIKIIDLNYQKDNLLTSSNLVKLNVLSTNSIVRDFNYDLSIPSALTSTIAIAAQNPDDPESLEEITFAAFNRGIKNRFSKPKSPETKVKKRPWEDLKNATETSFDKKFRRLKKQRLELETYLQRLKGPNTVQKEQVDTSAEQFQTEFITSIEENPFVQKVIEYNETVDNEEYEIKLG